MPRHRPSFLITIDTEGDSLWARPGVITTRNADFLPRFQLLCERHGLRPSYLVNYEMARADAFRAFGHDVLRRNTAEIGMHLHAWNSPPGAPLTANDLVSQPYLIDFPERMMREKIAFLTNFLEDTFGVPMISHRAGRWAFNETYARILVEHGYRVDCSVTPHISWSGNPGGIPGRGGSDYSKFPDDAYFVDLEHIGRPGDSPLLEIPMTIVPADRSPLDIVGKILRHRSFARHNLARRVANRFFAPLRWLRPDRRNRVDMIRIVERAADDRRPYVEFMVHSSELMPGVNPLFRTEAEIDALYDSLEALFETAARRCVGATLQEYHDALVGRRSGIAAAVESRATPA